MEIQKTINCGPIQVVAILAAFAFTQSAQAECINTIDPPASLLFNIDANNGCDDITGQEGCYIKGGVGTCYYAAPFDVVTGLSKGGFTVVSYISDGSDGQEGSLAWKFRDHVYDDNGVLITHVVDGEPVPIPVLGADTIVFGGGAGGKNNCGMGYKSDVQSGYGGDCKDVLNAGVCDTTVFQNFTGLSVCSDLETDEAPPEVPVAIDLPTCGIPTASVGEELGDDLDNTGIICPGNGQETVVCNFEKDKPAWGTIGANELGQPEEVCCRCNPSGKPVTSCFVSDDQTKNEADCETQLLSDPTQEVIITLEKDSIDPCTKIVSGGKVYKTCW